MKTSVATVPDRGPRRLVLDAGHRAVRVRSAPRRCRRRPSWSPRWSAPWPPGPTAMCSSMTGAEVHVEDVVGAATTRVGAPKASRSARIRSSRSPLPCAKPLLGRRPGAGLRDHPAEPAAVAVQAPRAAAGEVVVDRGHLVLAGRPTRRQVGVHEAGEREVDQPVHPAERQRGLGPLAGEHVHPPALSAGLHQRQHLTSSCHRALLVLRPRAVDAGVVQHTFARTSRRRSQTDHMSHHRPPAPPARQGPRPRPPSAASSARVTCRPPPTPTWSRGRARPRPRSGERVFVLGHHYQRDEVIEFADVTGDSFKLARDAAARPDAEFIVFCGVHFMAESADILTAPDQKVILPDLAAGLLDGRHGAARPGRGRLGRDGRRRRAGRRRTRDLHELQRRHQGLLRPQRRRRLHVVQRRRGARVGVRAEVGPRCRRQGPLPPRPAPRAQHRRAARWACPSTTASCGTRCSPDGGLTAEELQRRADDPVEGPLLGARPLQRRRRRRAARQAPGHQHPGPPRVHARGRPQGRPGRARPSSSSRPSRPPSRAPPGRSAPSSTSSSGSPTPTPTRTSSSSTATSATARR